MKKAVELYQTSHIRANILECLDWSSEWRVLEISGEEGALTGVLASKTAEVISLIGDKDACNQNRIRNAQHNNIQYVQKNLRNALAEQEDAYDVIVSVTKCGLSLEYLLTQAGRLLKSGGKMLYACDNRLGLKYLAGCQREPEGGYFTGIQGQPGERLYMKKELDNFMQGQSDMWDYEVFYPYPDQYYPMSIYSERYLPKMGELNANGIVSEHARLTLFNEERAYDTILKEGLYGEMANAFLLVIRRR